MRHARLHKILSGLTSLNVFDLGGRKLGMDDPDLGSWSYAYDALGNLTRQADARGQRVCLYYDALNRLSGKHYRLDDACPTSAPGSLDVAYLYDGYNPQSGQYGIGYRTGMVDDSGSTSWRYDTRGRVSQETKAITGSGSFTTQWTYNSADLLESLTYPGGSNNQAGETLIYDYHPQMALKSVYSSSGYYYVPGISYDAAGRVDVRKLGAASLGALPTLQVDYDYFDWGLVNGQGRLKRIQAGPPGNPAGLLDLRYFSETNTPAYDAVGNLLKIYDFKTGSPQTQTYMYDALDRLISASADGTTGNYSENYTYDLATGNLASKDGVNYSYDLNHPHAVTHLGGVQKYWYNANGNMTQRVTNVGTYSLGYDAENRLTAVSGAANAMFVYDGDSRRVASTIGVTTAYIGDYFEWNSSTSMMKKYYYAGGTRIALREGNGGGTTGLLWLLGDQLGSTSVVANSSGGLHSKILYKAWGEPRYASASLPTPYTYTGQYNYTDDITTPGVTEGIGLMFYNARWYDPALNQFNQPDLIISDPYNPLDWNRYGYARNNPVKYTDPSGHCPICVIAALVIGAIVLTADTPQIPPPPTADGNASNLGDLLQLGIEHATSANIVGRGLQDLQSDPHVKGAQDDIIADIISDPQYQKQPFEVPISEPEGFTANGPDGNWVTGALTGNPSFWMVHTANLYATNTHVSADGTISTTWKVEDQFDYLPAWGDHFRTGASYWAYNGFAQLIAPIYHGLLQVEPLSTNACWNQTHPPEKKLTPK